VNTVARLAIDSGGPETTAAVAAYGLFAIGVYAATRRLIDRIDPAAL
jgi:hypothetical protein